MRLIDSQGVADESIGARALSASMGSDAVHIGYIRALVNSTLAHPEEINIGVSSDYRTMELYLPNVPEGSYTIKIQWRSSHSDYGIAAYKRLMIVTALPN